MSGARLAARIVLAVVFALSGVTKLADPSGTRRAVTDLGVPARWSVPVGRSLPVIELGVVALVAIGATAWWGGLLAFVLLATFTAAIAVNLSRGRRPDCHCFGRLRSGPIGGQMVARNLVLAVPAVLLVLTA